MLTQPGGLMKTLDFLYSV